MASSSRNPKNLRQIVSASQQDMDDMQSKLSKLRSLSEDEKGEAALLRSRINEQSQLIMMLKQTSDESSNRIKTLERINIELEQFRDEANETLQRELRKVNMLDARFNDLASNHLEMIKIKDEYKSHNKVLQIENARLKEDNANLFSKEIINRDNKIADLQNSLSIIKSQSVQLERKNRSLEAELRETKERYRDEVKNLNSILSNTKEQLKGAQSKVLQQTHQQQSLDQASKMTLQKILKEKDELLELAMERGKVIQEKVKENKKLQHKVEDMEKSVREMQIKFEREAAAVNASLAVQQLKMQAAQSDAKYTDIRQEFQAFKKHTTDLLQKEKELNAKLRHLVG